MIGRIQERNTIAVAGYLGYMQNMSNYIIDCRTVTVQEDGLDQYEQTGYVQIQHDRTDVKVKGVANTMWMTAIQDSKHDRFRTSTWIHLDVLKVDITCMVLSCQSVS